MFTNNIYILFPKPLLHFSHDQLGGCFESSFSQITALVWSQMCHVLPEDQTYQGLGSWSRTYWKKKNSLLEKTMRCSCTWLRDSSIWSRREEVHPFNVFFGGQTEEKWREVMAFLTSPILPLPPMGATLSSNQGSEYLMILNPMDKIVLFTFNSFEIR